MPPRGWRTTLHVGQKGFGKRHMGKGKEREQPKQAERGKDGHGAEPGGQADGGGKKRGAPWKNLVRIKDT